MKLLNTLMMTVAVSIASVTSANATLNINNNVSIGALHPTVETSQGSIRVTHGKYRTLSAQEKRDIEISDVCVSTGELARSIMEARLSGMPINEAIQVASEVPYSVEEITTGMVLDAYLNEEFYHSEYSYIYPNYFFARYYLDCIQYYYDTEK